MGLQPGGLDKSSPEAGSLPERGRGWGASSPRAGMVPQQASSFQAHLHPASMCKELDRQFKFIFRGHSAQLGLC